MQRAEKHAAMQAQNYRVGRETCSTCANFQTERGVPARLRKLWPEDTKRLERVISMRCGIGGFPVKETATCDSWSPKNTDEA